jgi:hypothetical protein
VSDLSRWCLAHYDLLHDFATPVATIIAGGVAVFVTRGLGQRQLQIAVQQERHAAVRLQHDLFERRIAVFNAIRDVLMEVARTSKVSDEAWYKFVRGVETTEFLFSQDIADYVADLRKRVSHLKHVAERLAANTPPIEPEAETFAKIRTDHANWLVGQLDFLVSKFKPALALEQHTATRLPKPN